MAVAADDDMVVDRNAERLCDINEFARHLHIGARRGRVAGGVIVDQYI